MDEFKNILFLDIETVACVQRYSLLDERMKVQWARKANFFRQRDAALNDEDLFHEKAGIYSEFGKIITISIGRFTENEKGERGLKTKCFSSHDETILLNEFKASIEKMDQPQLRLCAHNGKEFDFPYISRRMLINGIALPACLELSGKKSWEIPHLDTLELWKFGDYKHYTSLDLLAAIFNIPSSKSDIDGSKVNEVYYRDRDLKKISDYCASDVVVVAQLFLKMKAQALVPAENIINS